MTSDALALAFGLVVGVLLTLLAQLIVQPVRQAPRPTRPAPPDEVARSAESARVEQDGRRLNA